MLTHRLATDADVPAIAALIDRALVMLQRAFLSPAQIEASRAAMGLDTQLIADRTYFLVEEAGALLGCGGWSYRAALYGGDRSGGRDAAMLDPARDPARIRAMYTDPAHARRGVGRLILRLCEGTARDAGFTSAALMATRAGRPLYAACGYQPIEEVESLVAGPVSVPGTLMRNAL